MPPARLLSGEAADQPVRSAPDEPLKDTLKDPMVGRIIGTYRIVRRLGKGGMGAVYEAVHERIGQRAAVKVLDPELSRQQKQVDRFFDEARAISMVPHPGLVKLFDFNRLSDGTVYILMEFLEGQTLWARYQKLREDGRWITLADATRVIRQMASALSAVHEKGIIHRDLKPENVMIVKDPEAAGGERAKLLDFGIAKMAESRGVRRTTVGTTLGTPYYMSPEQCKGAENITDRSDVYSLGVLLYEMLAGRPPFDSQVGSMIMAGHVYRDPPPLHKLPAPPPAELSGLVGEMLAKDPERRPSMAQVASRLEQIGAAGIVPSYEPSMPLILRNMQPTVVQPQAITAPRRPRRQVLLLAGGITVILAMLIALVLVLRPAVQAPSPAPPRPAVPAAKPQPAPPPAEVRPPVEEATPPPAPPQRVRHHQPRGGRRHTG